MSNIYNDFSKHLVSSLINKATQNIILRQSTTKYEQTQKGNIYYVLERMPVTHKQKILH